MGAAPPFVQRRAEEWLREQLADGQPHSAGQLLALAKHYGFAERTLQEARRSIGASTAKQYALNAEGIKRLQAHVWQLMPTGATHLQER